MVSKDRQAKGERSGVALFTEEEVRQLRLIKLVTGFTVIRIAKAYRKQRETIGRILSGKSYKYVT